MRTLLLIAAIFCSINMQAQQFQFESSLGIAKMKNANTSGQLDAKLMYKINPDIKMGLGFNYTNPTNRIRLKDHVYHSSSFLGVVISVITLGGTKPRKVRRVQERYISYQRQVYTISLPIQFKSGKSWSFTLSPYMAYNDVNVEPADETLYNGRPFNSLIVDDYHTFGAHLGINYLKPITETVDFQFSTNFFLDLKTDNNTITNSELYGLHKSYCFGLNFKLMDTKKPSQK